MKSILEIFIKIAENEDITIGKLEQIIGASKGVLSRAINNKTDIQTKWLLKLVDNYSQYNPNWLLTGNGDMLKEEKSTSYKVNEDTNNTVDEPVAVMVPISATSNDRIIKLLEAQISLLEENKAMQQDKIDTQAKEIAYLKKEITRLKSDYQNTEKIPSVPDDPMPPLPAGTSSKSRSHLRK